MDVVLKYRGRMIRESDLPVIRALIEENPTASRRELSQKLCEVWNWTQPNGALCDMVCRGAMLALDRSGHIALPPVRFKPPNPLAVRPKPRLVEIDTTLVECSLRDLGALEFRLVRRTAEEPLFVTIQHRQGCALCPAWPGGAMRISVAFRHLEQGLPPLVLNSY
jgi:hypothetical protein